MSFPPGTKNFGSKQRCPLPEFDLARSFSLLTNSRSTEVEMFTESEASSEHELGSRIVTLIVGPEKKLFRVHFSVLEKNDVLKNLCLAIWDDDDDNSCLILPDDDPGIFVILLRFLYHGRTKSFADTDAGHLQNMTELYILADKYGVDMIKDSIITWLKRPLNVSTVQRLKSIHALYVGLEKSDPRVGQLFSESVALVPHRLKPQEFLELKDILAQGGDFVVDFFDYQCRIEEPQKMKQSSDMIGTGYLASPSAQRVALFRDMETSAAVRNLQPAPELDSPKNKATNIEKEVLDSFKQFALTEKLKVARMLEERYKRDVSNAVSNAIANANANANASGYGHGHHPENTVPIVMPRHPLLPPSPTFRLPAHLAQFIRSQNEAHSQHPLLSSDEQPQPPPQLHHPVALEKQISAIEAVKRYQENKKRMEAEKKMQEDADRVAAADDDPFGPDNDDDIGDDVIEADDEDEEEEASLI